MITHENTKKQIELNNIEKEFERKQDVQLEELHSEIK